MKSFLLCLRGAPVAVISAPDADVAERVMYRNHLEYIQRCLDNGDTPATVREWTIRLLPTLTSDVIGLKQDAASDSVGADK